MKFFNIVGIIFAAQFFVSSSFAQQAEITISLNEQFFDTLLDGIFRNAPPPEFSIGSLRNADGADKSNFQNVSFDARERSVRDNAPCKETIQLMRELNGVRTAVRFREGKIFAPLSFSGNYNPPFIGCVPFSGYAETIIELQFDQNSQRLVANAKVLNVSLTGSGGVGGSVIARMVQSSIDKKINPIEILSTEKVSFILPLQNSNRVRMKAAGVRHEVLNGVLNIHIAYEFVKV